MTITRPNHSRTDQTVYPQTHVPTSKEAKLLAIAPTKTSERAPQREELLQSDEKLFESPKRGWLETRVLQQAQRLNSSGDQASLKFTAKAKAHLFEQRTEISAVISRTGTPAEYALSFESSQLVGVATPHGSPIQAFAGIGSGAKIEFSFSTPEKLAEAVNLLASGDSFQADAIAAEFQVKGTMDASLDLGQKIGEDSSLNIAQMGAQAKHQHSVRYESKAGQPVHMKMVTLTEFEVKGSVGPEVTGKKANGDDENFRGVRGDASGVYIFEHTRIVALDAHHTSFSALMKDPLSKHDGKRLPDQVRYQKQSKAGLSVSDSSFSPAQAQGTQTKGTTFELKVEPDRFSLFQTFKKATQGTAEIRAYFSQLGETKVSHFDLSERCHGVGISHGNGALFASMSIQACHQDRQQRGPVARYMDKACIIPDQN